MLQGLIVDLDDTLVDTAGAKARARAAVMREVAASGLDATACWRAFERVEPGLFELFERGAIAKDEYRLRRFADALGAAGAEPPPDLSARLNRVWLEETTERATLLPDARGFLEAAARADLPVVVLSNGMADEQGAKVAAAGIRDAVDDVLVSESIGAAKPSRAAFECALRALGLPPGRAAMLGNSLFHDVEGAAAAGIPAILVDRAGEHPEYAGPKLPGLDGAIPVAKAASSNLPPWPAGRASSTGSSG